MAKNEVETSVPVRHFQVLTVLGTKEHLQYNLLQNFWDILDTLPSEPTTLVVVE